LATSQGGLPDCSGSCCCCCCCAPVYDNNGRGRDSECHAQGSSSNARGVLQGRQRQPSRGRRPPPLSQAARTDAQVQHCYKKALAKACT
jgi:hypothetical protein